MPLAVALLVGVALLALGACGQGDDTAAEPETVTVVGSLFDDADGLRLCESVAESYPPQCGEPVHPVDASAVELPPFTTEGDVSWSESVTVTGEVTEDGTILASSIEPY